MKIKVDGVLCTGHGRCWALAPKVFEPDDEGLNAQAGQVVEVSAEREDEARQAILGCPEGALVEE
jgi:ferredoxin